MHDDVFLEDVTTALSTVPGVLGVALGGSQARGVQRPDSDWDLAVYYRDTLDVEQIRALGWPGELTELGGWGSLFNGGGKVTVHGRDVDIHYRDLNLIERIHEDAEQGRFYIDPLLFHQAGIPSYILLAELGINRPLWGEVPRWAYPDALRTSASAEWWWTADMTLVYADGHARRGRVAQCAGLMSEAACRAGHAILAARGEWVTNEKGLLAQAGVDGVDELVLGLSADPTSLVEAVRATREMLSRVARGAGVAVGA